MIRAFLKLSKMWIRGALNCLTHCTMPQTIRVPLVFKCLGRLCVIDLAIGARPVSTMFDGCQPSSDDVDVPVPSPKSFSPKLTSRLGLGKLRSGMGLAVRIAGSWICERHRLMNREATRLLGFLDRTCGRNNPTKMFLTRSTYRSELSNVASKMYVQEVMIKCSITREREQSERERERERQRERKR
jgi:hypothetical protein